MGLEDKEVGLTTGKNQGKKVVTAKNLKEYESKIRGKSEDKLTRVQGTSVDF